jgi:putative transposase
VGNPKDYRWSSYHVSAYGKKDLLVDEHPIYKQLSAGETVRRKRHREFLRGNDKGKGCYEG